MNKAQTFEQFNLEKKNVYTTFLNDINTYIIYIMLFHLNFHRLFLQVQRNIPIQIIFSDVL